MHRFSVRTSNQKPLQNAAFNEHRSYSVRSNELGPYWVVGHLFFSVEHVTALFRFVSHHAALICVAHEIRDLLTAPIRWQTCEYQFRSLI